MKKTLFLLASISIISFVGCATPTSPTSYTTGRDFPAELIVKIQKKSTTTDELIALLGEPYSKLIVSESEERWGYMYSRSSLAKRASLSSPATVEYTQKSLDVLIKDGIVVNYAYTEHLPSDIIGSD